MKQFILFAGFSILICATSCKTVQKTSVLDFNAEAFTTQTLKVNDKEIKVRAYENISYVENPVDTIYQKMNIYIPAEYFENKTINGYSADNAPIFFPNQIGGYMPGNPGTAINNGKGMGGMQSGPTTIAQALAKGYVVASAGARGRTFKTGKAPAAIVDLKAAVRYLKFNDKKMAGDANKIISNGTSAGGALSALLGATGNNKDYEPYLKALGAADATDDIFAVSAYCPITNLDHADMAYEWQFNGVNDYKKIDISMLDYNVQRKEVSGTLSANEINVSNQLKAAFPEYVNSLQLKDANGNLLQLDKDGNGNFKELVKSYVIASAQKTLDKGTDLSALKWLTIENGKITALDFDGYVRYMERMKTPPAFDALDLSSGENQLFGNETTDSRHFTKFALANTTKQGGIAEEKTIKMMNPMYYIGTQGTTTTKHWRIRHGTKDKDTGLGISVLLATLLQNNGYDVNLELPWDRPHSGDYDLDELFTWIDKTTK
ncbi:subtype B tannase [Sphingobacterium siyangense]|uniref:Acetyl esterase/lipase n=1 Tax=Sphingobacterium siyangense TaxID=459529 RepID=A0A562MG24_9SPHI|nr:subtype B tannase [Sphingobacterium siyangense]TWI18850.1 acetyl esterase/lipase [Sphingobacterium siyangense]